MVISWYGRAAGNIWAIFWERDIRSFKVGDPSLYDESEILGISGKVHSLTQFSDMINRCKKREKNVKTYKGQGEKR